MGIFDKLFGNKTAESAKTTTTATTKTERPAAVLSSTTPVVQYDESAPVEERQKVLDKSFDVKLLLEVTNNDNNDAIRQHAEKRLCTVLEKTSGEANQETLFQSTLSPKACKKLAIYAHSQALRDGFLLRIEGNQALLEVASLSPHIDTQVAAISRINDEIALKKLIQRFKGKRKKVYRAAKDRITDLRARHQHTTALEQQIEALEQAAEDQTLSLTAIVNAEKHLAESHNDLSRDLYNKFEQAIENLKELALEIDTQKSTRLAILDALSSIHDQLDTNQFSGSRQDFNTLINEQQHKWAQLPSWQAADAKVLDIRFEQNLSQVNTTANRYFDSKQYQDAHTDVLAQCKRWLEGQFHVTEDMLKAQEQRWQELKPVGDKSVQDFVQKEFSELMEKLHKRSQQQIDTLNYNDEFVASALDDLEEKLENGELTNSEKLHDDIEACLNSEVGVSKWVQKAVHGRFKRLKARLSELKRWQQFGEGQVRQELIDAMRCLAEDEDIHIETKAEQVKALQQRWKGIEGHAPKAMWNEFKRLGNIAWAPCAEYFESQRQVANVLLQERLGFLNEIQRHLDGVDWSNPNWKATAEANKKFEQIWREFPRLPEKQYQKAKKAYDKIATEWDKHLEGERQREFQRRENLIKRAEAERNTEDANAAIAVIKQLQKQWTPTLGLKKPSEEKALWSRFKGVCDSIFEKHGQQRAEVQAAIDESIKRYQQQLAQIEALLDDKLDFDTLKKRFNEAVDAVADFGDLPQKAAHSLRGELNRIVARFDAYQHEVLLDKRLDYLTQLNSQDLICIQLEQEKRAPERLISLSKTWDNIEPLLNDGQSRMRKRFEHALTTQQQGQVIEPDTDSIAEAQEICLLLELAAGLPSPEYAQPAREALRLRILDASMNGDKSFEHFSTEAGLYDVTVRWRSLPKGALNETLSQDSLWHWRSRFDNSVAQIRKNNKLKQVRTPETLAAEGTDAAAE